jgi:hypothetical protein
MKAAFISVLAAVLGIGAAIAGQGDKQTQEAGYQPSKEAVAAMSPGPMHKHLDALVGDWTFTGKWRMAPEDAWQDFEATVEREWILDGRFIHETVKSEWMGQPFEGMGLIGYDNLRKQYDMIWVENASTATFHSTGKADPTGKIFTFEGTNSNQMTLQKDCWSRSTLTIKSDTEHVHEGYGKDATGKEFKNMEGTAKRK